jgi:hypothetical protein
LDDEVDWDDYDYDLIMGIDYERLRCWNSSIIYLESHTVTICVKSLLLKQAIGDVEEELSLIWYLLVGTMNYDGYMVMVVCNHDSYIW